MSRERHRPVSRRTASPLHRRSWRRLPRGGCMGLPARSARAPDMQRLQRLRALPKWLVPTTRPFCPDAEPCAPVGLGLSDSETVAAGQSCSHDRWTGKMPPPSWRSRARRIRASLTASHAAGQLAEPRIDAALGLHASMRLPVPSLVRTRAQGMGIRHTHNESEQARHEHQQTPLSTPSGRASSNLDTPCRHRRAERSGNRSIDDLGQIASGP